MNKHNEFFKLARGEEYAAAIESLGDISIDELKETPDVLFALADCTYETRDSDKALRLYELYLHIAADGRAASHARYNAALILHEKLRHRDAVQILNKILVPHPDKNILKGECLYYLGQFSEAIMVLEMESTGSTESRLFWYLGLCFNATDKHHDALASFQKCLELEGESEGVCGAIITELIWLGRRMDAYEFYQKHRKVLKHTDSLKKIGASFNAHGEFEDSIRMLKTYLRSHKEDAEALRLLGINFYLITPPNLRRSELYLKRALEIEPTSKSIQAAIDRLRIYREQHSGLI